MKVICISGKARHGKDTAANFMKKSLEKTHKERVLIIHNADLLKYICKNIFDWDGIKDEAGRRMLRYVGTDVIREQNPDYWIDFIIGILKMFPDIWDYVLIPDCRFPNEIDKLKENGFETYSVKIVRDGFDNGLTKEQLSHISETALDNYDFDYIIHNSSLSNLYSELADLLSGLSPNNTGRYEEISFYDEEAL